MLKLAISALKVFCLFIGIFKIPLKLRVNFNGNGWGICKQVKYLIRNAIEFTCNLNVKYKAKRDGKTINISRWKYLCDIEIVCVSVV